MYFQIKKHLKKTTIIIFNRQLKPLNLYHIFEKLPTTQLFYASMPDA